MTELKQIVHHLLGPGAIVAGRMIQLPLLKMVVHDQRWIPAVLEFFEIMVAVIGAQAKHAIDVSALEYLDMLAFLDKLGLGLLEHDLVPQFSRPIADTADQL